MTFDSFWALSEAHFEDYMFGWANKTVGGVAQIEYAMFKDINNVQVRKNKCSYRGKGKNTI